MTKPSFSAPTLSAQLSFAMQAIDDATQLQLLSTQQEQGPPESAPVARGAMFKKRAKFGSAQKNIRKPLTASDPTSKNPPSAEESEESVSGDEEKVTRRSGIIAGQKRKRGGVQAATTTKAAASGNEADAVAYDVTKTDVRLDPKSQATAVSAEFSESELLGRSNTAAVATTAGSDNLYRGQKGYRSLLPQREQITTKYNPVGPQKAASNVRMTTYTDYAPDVCKDYKLTGYCGFGDNCKFLHDRGDYKAGWQIDRDWEIEQQKKSEVVEKPDDSDTDDEMGNVPFVCLICREDYEDPVVTKCGHYYCMTCAVKRYKQTPNCLVCGTGTMGIFNRARDFEKKLEAKRSRQEEKERRKQGLELEDAGSDEDFEEE